ncbi:MAG: alanine--tRNA ligase [Candidatus Altiarchaeota archaeon]
MSFYEVSLFKEKNFIRNKCNKCGRFFWSLSEKEICGEPPCSEYSFIGHSVMKKKLNLHDMREEFLNFFEKRNHKRIARYPVVARWRDDIFFTIASISCFQPWVLNRTIEPPANPLVMSQPSLRFNDIDNVGKTGRHLTLFEMMAHHAFNTKENFIYFNDKTVELCHEFLCSLGIPEEDINYMESEWSGGGNSGPCFEVIIRGLEVATLVFMVYEDLPTGKKELDMQVVDTGYGLERFTWLSLALPNVYESIFKEVLEKLKKEAKISTDEKILAEYSKLAGTMDIGSNLKLKELRRIAAERLKISVEELTSYINPLENLYAICDHTRALVFMLNDGIIPSNVKGGYFARLLARRTLRSIKFLNLKISLGEILELQIESLKSNFPVFQENKDDILRIISVEEKKYRNTVNKGRAIVCELEKKCEKENRKINIEDLIKLYDTYGLTPELVKDFLNKSDLEIPDDFYIQVSKKHEKPEEIEFKEKKLPLPDEILRIAETKLGFYEDVEVRKFKAKVLAKFDNFVILDKTYFYAESGGQEADHGKISGLEVIDTKKEGNIILHKIKAGIEKLKVGQEVECEINWQRRLQLMQHHTSAHIINGAARRVLGKHVFQAGAHKSEKLGRLDITHYESLSEEELKKIEELANKVVNEKREIEIKFMPRNEAEEKFGFNIYQGGAVPGRIIRVVNIKDWDVEACGGTHFNNTGKVGKIKLLRAKRIQDGVVRLEFKSGRALSKYSDEISEICKEISTEEISEEELKKIANVFSVSIDKVSKTIERFRYELISREKVIEMLKNEIISHGGKITERKIQKEICVRSSEDAEKLFKEWKSQSKYIEKLSEQLVGILNVELKKYRGKTIKKLISGLETNYLMKIAKSLPEVECLIMISNTEDKVNFVVSSNSKKLNALEIAKDIAKKLNGGCHGNENFAVGGGYSKDAKKIFESIKI